MNGVQPRIKAFITHSCDCLTVASTACDDVIKGKRGRDRIALCLLFLKYLNDFI